MYATQYGGVLQLQKLLPWNCRIIGAFRIDQHDKIGAFISPRVALQKNLQHGSFRITWGRAYSIPNLLFQSAQVNGIVFGNGDGISYIPNNSVFSDPASVTITQPLKPEEVQTWELGYRGSVVKNMFIDVNYYTGISQNFLTPNLHVGGRALRVGNIPVTPAFSGDVINDTLKNASFFTWFNYGKVKVNGLDVGITYSFSNKISFTTKYSWLNSDITKENMQNDANSDGYHSTEERSLNAPRNRGVAMLQFQNLFQREFFFRIATRFVEQYDFYSGNLIGTAAGEGKRGRVYGGKDPGTGQDRWHWKNFDWGPLGGFVSVDLSTGWKLNETTSVAVNVTNLFNAKQRELVSAPLIRRLFSAELKVHVPEKQKTKS